PLRDLVGHGDRVLHARFSPDAKRVVTASADHTARIWDANTGRVVAILEGHTGPVLRASFSPDGNFVVTASRDNSATIWDAIRGNKLLTLRSDYEGGVLDASFSQDGRHGLVAFGNEAVIADIKTGKSIVGLIGHTDRVRSASFSSDGKSVVTASS